MTRQLEDNRTGDLLGGAIRQRGRPSTGRAMTGAERQAARRTRLVDEGKTTLTVGVSIELMEALTAFALLHGDSKDALVERLLRSELMPGR